MENGYMRQLYDFFVRLGENNNRAWFAANKPEFDHLRSLLLADLQRLIGLMAEYDPSLRGLNANDTLYRIYRDIRFTPIKLPYKTHLGSVIAKGGKRSIQSNYYVHFEPGESGLYGGLWDPTSDLLRQLRQELDGNIDEWVGIVESEEFASRYTFVGRTLKTMPKGYPKDHPYSKYIKMKEYLVEMRLPDEYFFASDWVERSAEHFKVMKPLHDFLNYVFE